MTTHNRNKIYTPEVKLVNQAKNSVTGTVIRTFLLENIPKFLLAEINTHRLFCLDGDSEIWFDSPSALKSGKKRLFKRKISTLYDMFNGETNRKRRSNFQNLDKIDKERWYTSKEIAEITQVNMSTIRNICSKNVKILHKIEQKNRKIFLIQGGSFVDNWDKNTTSFRHCFDTMNVRQIDTNLNTITHTKITDITVSGVQDIFEIALADGKKIRLTSNHRILGNKGYFTLQEYGVTKYTKTWSKDIPLVATNGSATTDGNGLFRDKNWLEDQLTQGKFYTEIADICGVSLDKVKKQGLKFGLKGNKNTQKGKIPWNKGKKYNINLQALISRKNNPNLKRLNKEEISLRKGNRNDRYQWIKLVKPSLLEKSGYCCEVTGLKDHLEIHHVDPVWHNPDKWDDENNCVVLNKDFHRFLHSKNLDLHFLSYHEQGKKLSEYLSSIPENKVPYRDLFKPKRVSDKKVRFSKIISIKYIGEKLTYDLSVAGEFENFIANGICVHNSRNFESSRARPNQKLIESLIDGDFYTPLWTENKPGMSGEPIVYDPQLRYYDGLWQETLIDLVYRIKEFDYTLPDGDEVKPHKQDINRLLEPFMLVSGYISFTHSGDFFAARTGEAAQPAIRLIAEKMQELIENNTVDTVLKIGEWYKPYPDLTMQQNVGKIAGVSYNRHNGDDTANFDKVYQKLLSADPRHFSPLEHVALCVEPGDVIPENQDKFFFDHFYPALTIENLTGYGIWAEGTLDDLDFINSGNFGGFLQYRKFIEKDLTIKKKC